MTRMNGWELEENVRLCSLMSAYVRLIGEKFLWPRPGFPTLRFVSEAAADGAVRAPDRGRPRPQRVRRTASGGGSSRGGLEGRPPRFRASILLRVCAF